MCGRRTTRRDAWHLHGADDRVQRTDALARRRPRASPSTSAATPAEAAAGSRHARSRSIRVGRGGPPGRNRAPPSRPFAERYLRQTPRYFRAGVPPGPPFGPADRELAAARHDRTIPVPASHASFAHAATGVHPRVKAKALPGAGGTGSMTSCGHGASRARWDRGRAKVAPAPAHRIRIGSRRRTSRLRGELVLDPHRTPTT
jgi:hypothetical protein